MADVTIDDTDQTFGAGSSRSIDIPALDNLANGSPTLENSDCPYDITKPLLVCPPVLPANMDALMPETGGGGQDVPREEESEQHSGGAGTRTSTKLLYRVDDIPPWYLCIFLGFQHYLSMVGGSISIPFILAPLLCIDTADPARGHLVSTLLFVSGLTTLLQTTLGVRLPVVQGGTFALLLPTIAILTTSFPRCEELLLANLTAGEREELWQVRMRELQGTIVVAGILQVLLGFTGVIGLLLTWISPLAIVPTITLIGVCMFSEASKLASVHWGISIMTMALVILFSQRMQNVPLPFPAYSRSSGCHVAWIQVFKFFPVLLGILVSWGLYGILTETGVLGDSFKAATNLTVGRIRDAPWFTVPYPGQWGMPTVNVGGVVGMMAGVLASIVESVGDYYACAKIAGEAPPPVHAVNRGIGVEGIGCVLAGLWGSGNGTTTYSDNIAALCMTKVCCRRVVQMAGVFMILFGMLGKFGAVFVSIPEPVMGGMFCVMFGLIAAIGLSTLQYVDLNSSRNLLILGFSIFMGLAVPKWMESNPGVINTGAPIADQILTVLLQTPMIVSGFLGLWLDNTLPGSPEERGLVKWAGHLTSKEKSEEGQSVVQNLECYDLPFGMDILRKTTLTQYIPFSPTFTGFCKHRKRSEVSNLSRRAQEI